MNMRIKKLLAVLLSAIMVVSVAFVSAAETQKYERPELNKEDTVKTTGKWKKDKKGVRRLETESGRAKDGWYYVNKPDSPTEYGWYHFDEKGNMSTGWIKDMKEDGIWHYTGETKDGEEGSLVTGWVTDPQDGKKYYMNPATGVMSSGWKKIGSRMYYFGERQYADVPWTKDANGHWTAGKGKHSFGTMYANEFTPDGYWVGANGAWKQPSAGGGSSGGGSSGGGSSGGGSSGGGSSHVAYGAEATTSTAQYAGTRFDPTGLKLTVYKNGAQYKTVSAHDPSVTILKILVNGEDKVLDPGVNEIEIRFLFKDGHLLTGQTMTTRVVGVYGLNKIPEGSIYLVDTSVSGEGYKFYDENGQELTEWKTKSTSADIVAALANATAYREPENKTGDKFYMYDPNGGAQDNNNTYYWTYYNDGWKYEFLGTSTKGKENTRLILENHSEYKKSKTGPAGSEKPTVWYWIDNLKNTKPLGYDDWFIPAEGELFSIRKKFETEKWTSEEAAYYLTSCAFTLKPTDDNIRITTGKEFSYYVFAVRSF